jgi:hypothetical protein
MDLVGMTPPEKTGCMLPMPRFPIFTGQNIKVRAMTVLIV